MKLLPPNTDRDLFLFNVAVENTALGASSADPFANTKNPQQPPPVLSPPPGAVPPNDPAPHRAPPGGFAPTPVTPAAPKAGKSEPGRDGKGGGEKKDEKPGESKPGDPDDAKKKSRDVEDRFYQDDRQKFVPRALYRKLDPTMEWAENNYYKLLISEQTRRPRAGQPRSGPTTPRTTAKAPFLSRHLPTRRATSPR